MGPYQVLPLRAIEDLVAMAMMGNSTFPKGPALLEYHYQIVQCHISGHSIGGGVLTLCRDAIGAFYNPKKVDTQLKKKPNLIKLIL